jgi:hypothetical protein
LVKLGRKRQIREIELIGRNKSVDIIARHAFGISIISLSPEDVLELREEIDEWLAEQTLEKQSLTTK